MHRGAGHGQTRHVRAGIRAGVRARVRHLERHSAIEAVAAEPAGVVHRGVVHATVDARHDARVHGHDARVFGRVRTRPVALAVALVAGSALVQRFLDGGRVDHHGLHGLGHAELHLVGHAELEVQLGHGGHLRDGQRHAGMQAERDRERQGEGVWGEAARAHGLFDATPRGVIHGASGGQGLTEP
ncbi:MAG: hypothetical protein IPH72_25350 [Sandaracinaceae bacterium]|nr:hypothetical protein [Sandaracinaceae bacterium]